MRLEVPLIPDEGYVRFLAEHRERLHGVHFSLHSALAADGRPPAPPCDPRRLAELLALLPGVPKYALLNSRFNEPEAYLDARRLHQLADLLDILRRDAELSGVVYVDQYLLQALSDARPDTCAELEAVPSVNAMLDSAPRALRRLRYIQGTAFRPPSKLVLDRSLNRDLPALAETSAALRAQLPDVDLVLLANEGCLPDCPFKPAHDSLISLSALPGGTRSVFGANARLGCGRQYATDPALILQSPFIRPEDAAAYAPHADALKLCGRTLPPGALTRIVRAYLDGRFDGNLLEILDSMEFLAPTLHLDNAALPADFQATVSACGHACHACSYCPALAARHIRRKHPGEGIGRL